MKLIIEISDKTYKRLKNRKETTADLNTICKAIYDGIPQKSLEKVKEGECKCIACKKIITDDRIFKFKDDPTQGLCFDCY